MWLPLHEAVQPNSILRRLLSMKLLSRFSYLQFWVWCPQSSGCLLLSLEEHLPKLPAPGYSCILLPDSVPLTKLMLTWWLQCWHVLRKPECCAGDEKILCHYVAKTWARVLLQVLWPGSDVLPELRPWKGFLQNRI